MSDPAPVLADQPGSWIVQPDGSLAPNLEAVGMVPPADAPPTEPAGPLALLSPAFPEDL